jgi:hypothetical protein
MVPFDAMVFNTSLVLGNTSDEEEAVISAEPSRGRKRVGEQGEEEASPEAAKGTDDEEFVTPGLERTFNMTTICTGKQESTIR